MMVRRATTSERQEIEELLELDEPTLFALLPEYDLEYEVTTYSTRSKLSEAGRKIFNRKRQHLYQKVCVEFEFCRRKEDPNLKDSVDLIASVSDIIMTVFFGIPPLIVTVIIFKIGFTKFCDCYNTTTDELTDNEELREDSE